MGLRVLFVTPYYKPAHLGGVERAIERLATALSRSAGVERLGVLTTAYAFPPRYVPGLPRRERLDGWLDVFRLPAWPRTPAPLFPHYSCPVTYFPPPAMWAVLRAFRPHVVHMVGDGWVWAHLWLLALRGPRTALVFTPSFHDLAGSRAWLRWPNRLLAAHAECTVVLTEGEARAVAAAYAPPAGRLTRIPWGVELPVGCPPTGAPAGPAEPLTILCVGRLGQHKGQAWLLDVYRRARPSFRRPARLVLAGKDEGDAGGRAALERQVVEGGLQGEVLLAGEVDEAHLQRLYAEAALFVLFSRYEAFGLVYFEALARGVPVLTHRVGANAELLARGAVLTAPYDAAQATAELVRLVNDDEARTRLGQEGRALVESTYSWEAVAGRYGQVYREALAERAQGRHAEGGQP